MLTVYIWLPHGNMVGHASLAFRSNYVSFWPEDSAGKKDLKIKRSHPSHFMAALREDIEAEGNRQPIPITIQNIDDDALSRYVAELISNTPRYQLARYNCSHLVAECIKIATGKEPSFTPTAQEYGKLAKVLGWGIWTPQGVLRYARELSTEEQTLA